MTENRSYIIILKDLQIPHQVHFWTFSYNYIDLCGNRYKYSRVDVHDNLIQFFDDGRECVRVEWDDENKWVVKELDEVVGSNYIKGDDINEK